MSRVNCWRRCRVGLDDRGRAGSPVHRGAVAWGCSTGLRSAPRCWPGLPPAGVAALTEKVTIDLDTIDVEVYGRRKRGVAYNYQGVRHEAPVVE